MLLCITRTLVLLLLPAAIVGAQETFDSMSKNAQLISAAKRNHTDRLERALRNSKSDVVETLLAFGQDPNARYHNNLTALMWAAGNGDAECVRVLLVAKADPKLLDNRGKIALDMAQELGHRNVVGLLEAARKPE